MSLALRRFDELNNGRSAETALAVVREQAELAIDYESDMYKAMVSLVALRKYAEGKADGEAAEILKRMKVEAIAKVEEVKRLKKDAKTLVDFLKNAARSDPAAKEALQLASQRPAERIAVASIEALSKPDVSPERAKAIEAIAKRAFQTTENVQKSTAKSSIAVKFLGVDVTLSSEGFNIFLMVAKIIMSISACLFFISFVLSYFGYNIGATAFGEYKQLKELVGGTLMWLGNTVSWVKTRFSNSRLLEASIYDPDTGELREYDNEHYWIDDVDSFFDSLIYSMMVIQLYEQVTNMESKVASGVRERDASLGI